MRARAPARPHPRRRGSPGTHLEAAGDAGLLPVHGVEQGGEGGAGGQQRGLRGRRPPAALHRRRYRGNSAPAPGGDVTRDALAGATATIETRSARAAAPGLGARGRAQPGTKGPEPPLPEALLGGRGRSDPTPQGLKGGGGGRISAPQGIRGVNPSPEAWGGG